MSFKGKKLFISHKLFFSCRKKTRARFCENSCISLSYKIKFRPSYYQFHFFWLFFSQHPNKFNKAFLVPIRIHDHFIMIQSCIVFNEMSNLVMRISINHSAVVLLWYFSILISFQLFKDNLTISLPSEIQFCSIKDETISEKHEFHLFNC